MSFTIICKLTLEALMGDFIKFFASDGTLNMPKEEKELFRLWAKQEISSAYPRCHVSVSSQRCTAMCLCSENREPQRKNIMHFVGNLTSRWKKIHS